MRTVSPAISVNGGGAARGPVRLIAFPYAGASSACYRALGAALPSHVALTTHELPGHGVRIREPLSARLSALADDVLERCSSLLEPPYAFYGHSFGAWLGHEVLRRLDELGRPLPAYFFVSGRRAPLSEARGPALHRLPSAALRARLHAWGGIPAAIAAEEDLMVLFERLLRADLEALETRCYAPGPPLDVPIHVLLGTDDDITPEQARAWQHESRAPLVVSHFNGGHFFIREHAGELGVLIGRTLLPWANWFSRSIGG